MSERDQDDDKLREALRTAHRGEVPPRFDALLERPSPGRPRRWPAPLVLGLAAAALALWARSHHHLPAPPPSPAPPPMELAALHIDASTPLDFLLRTPGDPLLVSTPRFDAKGDWP
jgi:hypothetical protein